MLAFVLWPVCADARDVAAGSIEGTVALPSRLPAGVVVAVYVDAPGPAAPPGARATIRQIDQRFVPRTTVVVRGTTVDFPNLGSEYHDVFGTGASEVRLTQYGVDDHKAWRFDEPGWVELGCMRHEPMHADLLVVPNPWYAFTDRSGRFRIDGVPPGTHQLAVWSPGLEGAPVAVDVTPGGVSHADLALAWTEVEVSVTVRTNETQ